MVYLDVFYPSAGHWWFLDSMDRNITLYTHILIYFPVLTYLCTVYINIYTCIYIRALMSKPHSIHREARFYTKPRPLALTQTARSQICYRMIASFAPISPSRCCWNACLMCRRTGEVALSIQTFRLWWHMTWMLAKCTRTVTSWGITRIVSLTVALQRSRSWLICLFTLWISINLYPKHMAKFYAWVDIM